MLQFLDFPHFKLRTTLPFLVLRRFPINKNGIFASERLILKTITANNRNKEIRKNSISYCFHVHVHVRYRKYYRISSTLFNISHCIGQWCWIPLYLTYHSLLISHSRERMNNLFKSPDRWDSGHMINCIIF